MSTRVTFLPGAYGPTLAIVPGDLHELVAIRKLFADLALGRILAADFLQSLNCQSDSVGALVLRVVSKDVPGAFTSHRSSRLGPDFWWSNTLEGWQDCADLTEALVLSDSPGHQYLTHEGADDILVELNFRETL